MPLNSPRGNPANLASIRKRFLQLNPVNAASGGQYSFRNGLPLIKFDISSSDAPMFLEGNELRLTGNITFRNINGNNLAADDTCFIDSYTGSIASVIDTITVSSKRLNTVLERCNLYSRMVPSITSGVHSEEDINVSLSHGGLHASTIPLMRPMVTAYNDYGLQGAVAAASQVGKAFSTPIYLGIVNSGEDLDLSGRSGIGGLTIEILLKSDVNCCFGVDAAANNVTYTLDNLMLTAPVYEMMGPAASQYQGGVNQFEFNSWSAIFQTINSSDSVIAFTPGLNRVASCFMNFITATDLGNQLFNYSRLGPIAQLRQVRYSKNGVLFPIQFRLETVEQENDNATRTAGTTLSNHTIKARAMPLRNYLESVRTDRYNKVSRTSLQWNGWSSGVLDRNQNAGRTGTTPGTADCLGILYDAYGSGTDFSQMVFSTEIQVSPDSTAQPNGVANSLTGAAANAQAVCLYFLNKNTLLFSPQGINVVR